MPSGVGEAVIDFGAHPGSNEASVAVTGQSEISPTSNAEAYVSADDTTTDHTASDHRYFAAFVGLSCSAPSGTSFTIHARSVEKLTGQFKVRWVWSD
ncbi:MAG: hypothetical protein ACK5ZS_00100 [bacterium]|jgi:hypothetical protein